MITFGSLFAGIGGLDLGLERSGMVCKWQVEIDDYASRVLAKHWPDVPRWQDIRTFPPAEGFAEVDLICGGFPCQDISYAGRGAGLEGERSGLFFEALRVVRQLRPRYVLLENVAALLTRGLDRVLGELWQIGYDAEWHCIPAAAVGAPHIRDRVFVVGYPNSKSQSVVTFDEEAPRVQRMDSNSRCRNGQRQRGAICRGPIAARWEPEPAVDRVANGIPYRFHRLTVLGNAVVPQVAEWIGRQIVAAD